MGKPRFRKLLDLPEITQQVSGGINPTSAPLTQWPLRSHQTLDQEENSPRDKGLAWGRTVNLEAHTHLGLSLLVPPRPPPLPKTPCTKLSQAGGVVHIIH